VGRRILFFAFALALALPGGRANAADGVVRLAYVEWSSAIASSNVICAVLEEYLGQRCELIPLTADLMWEAVAEGEADAMVSAWLPDTHRHYLERFGAQMVDLGPNLEGTRTGLVIPDVSAGRQTDRFGRRGRHDIEVTSIPELDDHRRHFGGRIVGIDPAAGVMRATREALAAYDLSGWRLIEGSEAQMTEALTNAIRRQEPIVVTGWVPHWMFGRWSLRMLEDPEGIYGGSGSIHTMVREGLAEDMPAVNEFLDRFRWTPADMEQLMLWIELDDGLDPYGKAVRWLDSHPYKLREWLGQAAP
jgi:glycine betaine/proline transport system substrate-binding protein